ncbi:MAG: polysaccharide biosynthesis tyrosine autokinase [Planctomycetes bacterium]|nr:polysaccharide biosynthesis tyrosine autokinase [Planctomycetota bacterium]
MDQQPPAPPYDVGNILRAQRKLMSGGNQPHREQADERQSAVQQFWVQSVTILRYRWPWGLASFLIVLIVTAVLLVFTPEQHRASGQMVLVQNVTGITGMDQLFSWRVYFSNIAISRLGSMSRTGMRAHAHLNSWITDPASRPPTLPELPQETAQALASLSSNALLGMVSVTPDTENVAVQVDAWGQDRVLIAYVAQAVLEGLIDTLIEHEKTAVNTSELERIILSTQNELNTIDKETSSIYSRGIEQGLIPEDISRALDKLEEINRQIEEARFEIIETDNRVRIYQSVLTNPEQLTGEFTLPPSLTEELMAKELLLDEYKRKYTPENPKYKKLVRELETLRETIRQVKKDPQRYGISGTPVQLSWQFQNLGLSVASERAKKAALEARIENLLQQRINLEKAIASSDIKNDTIRLRMLDKRREALRSLLNDLNRRLEQARWVQEGLDKHDPNFTKVEQIPVSVSHADAPRAAVIVVALLLGLAAAAFAMHWIEATDPTIHGTEATENLAKAPVLADIPFFNADPFIFPENPSTRTANVFSHLRNHLRYSSTNHPEKAVVVTSPRPGDGKTFVAVNLAISFAQEGNSTVLMDCDLRHARKDVYREALLLQGTDNMGLLPYFENPQIPLENILAATEMPELVVIPAGGVAHNPPRLLRSQAFTSLLATLEEHFDVVIIDTPPVIPVVDAGVIAEQARGVLVVAKWGVTRNRELSTTVERVRHVRGTILGMALNWSPKGQPDYYYYAQNTSTPIPAAGD